MQKLKCKIFLIILASIGFAPGHAQSDESLIYGEIITVNNEVFKGHIRWGKPYVMWNDILYAEKKLNPVKYFLSDEEIEKLKIKPNKRYSFSFIDLWDPSMAESESAFKCYFGFIKSLQVIGEESARVELKNGIQMDIEDDMIGDDILVYDEEKGRKKLDWEKIDRIEFLETPEKLKHKHGDPLYGKVISRYGTFEGYILWDNECCGTDILSGEWDDRDKDYPYRDIYRIKREDKHFIITLHNGKTQSLCCSDDLNINRSHITIKNKELGQLEIKMRDLKEVIFYTTYDDKTTYQSYNHPERIRAGISTVDNNTISGEMIYDLDEALTSDILDGEMENLNFRIPFYLISEIRPINYIYTEITLLNGNKYTLTGHSDVSDRNNGVIIQISRNRAMFMPWNKVKKVIIQ